MKIKKTSKNNKKTLIVVAILLVIAAMSFALYSLYKNNAFNTTTAPGVDSQEQQKADDESKKEYLEQEGPGVSEEVQKDTSATPAVVNITAEKNDNGSVTIFTNIKNLASGECNLSVSRGSEIFTDKAQLIYQSEYSTCAGFSVPITRLGNGTWSIKLNVTSDGKTYEANTSLSV